MIWLCSWLWYRSIPEKNTLENVLQPCHVRCRYWGGAHRLSGSHDGEAVTRGDTFLRDLSGGALRFNLWQTSWIKHAKAKVEKINWNELKSSRFLTGWSFLEKSVCQAAGMKWFSLVLRLGEFAEALQMNCFLLGVVTIHWLGRCGLQVKSSEIKWNQVKSPQVYTLLCVLHLQKNAVCTS